MCPVPDNICTMKSPISARLDELIRTRLDVSGGVSHEASQYHPGAEIRQLADLILDTQTPKLVIVIDESDSMRVVASNPSKHSCKLQLAQMLSEIARYLRVNHLNHSTVIRLGANRSMCSLKSSIQRDSAASRQFGKTEKSRKTAYILRNTLMRMSDTGHMVIVSDFRSHMWRRNLNALISAGPKITLVHLVDESDCDFVLSSADQLELAIQPDPSPWNTPLVDSHIPPSDIHGYLSAFSDLNGINLLGIVVKENTLEEFMCTFERAIIDA